MKKSEMEFLKSDEVASIHLDQCLSAMRAELEVNDVDAALLYYLQVQNLMRLPYPRNSTFHDNKTGESEQRRPERDQYSERFPTSTSKEPINLVLTDSLALPREKEGTTAELTWPMKLAQHLNGPTKSDCLRGRTMVGVDEALARQDENISTLIIQAGIVDCVPRLQLPNEPLLVKQHASNINFRAYIDMSKRYADRLPPPASLQPYIPSDLFQKSLARIACSIRSRRISNCVFIAILAPDPLKSSELRPSWLDPIRAYNKAIEDLCRIENFHFLDLLKHSSGTSSDENFYSSDGYHLGNKGHEVLAEALLAQILRANHLLSHRPT